MGPMFEHCVAGKPEIAHDSTRLLSLVLYFCWSCSSCWHKFRI